MLYEVITLSAQFGQRGVIAGHALGQYLVRLAPAAQFDGQPQPRKRPGQLVGDLGKEPALLVHDARLGAPPLALTDAVLDGRSVV